MWIESSLLLLCLSSANAVEHEIYLRPQIIRGPGVKKVSLGKSVKYECEAYGNPTPALTWLFNDTTIKENDWYEITVRNSISTLHIKRVDVALEGDYCCNADDGHYIASYCGRLRVKRGGRRLLVSPTITKHPSNKSTKIGEYTTFQCEVDAFPKPIVMWSHNGRVINCIKKLYDSCGSYVLTYSNALRIIDAKSSDEGWYSCSAVNDLGKSESHHAYLTVAGSDDVTSPDGTHNNRKSIISNSVSTGSVLTTEGTTPPLTGRSTLPPVTTPAQASSKIAADGYSTTDAFETTVFSTTLKPDRETTLRERTLPPETDSDGVSSIPPLTTPRVSTMDSPTAFTDVHSTLPGFHSEEEARKISESLLDNLYHVSSLDHESPNNTVITASFVGTCLVLCTAVFLCWVAKKRKRLERQSTMIMKCHRSIRESKASDAHCNIDIEDCLLSLSYPVEKLKILDELGEGVFGQVFKASAPGILDGKKDGIVAVKTIRAGDRKNESRVEDFNREAELLATFRHDNIVQLLGICFNDKDEDCDSENQNISCLLFEYVDGGDLCAFLRSRGPNRSLFQLTMSDSYEDWREIGEQDKLTICTHIACGMKYLSEKNFVHRWMAPESILYGKYSMHSDVWAFGVTLWEVYTYALQPYFSLTNEEVICCICEGNILSAPPDVPNWMYNLMQLCWRTTPDCRPNFSTIYSVLEAIRQNDGKLPLHELMPSDVQEAEDGDGRVSSPRAVKFSEEEPRDDRDDDSGYVICHSALLTASGSAQSLSGKESNV